MEKLSLYLSSKQDKRLAFAVKDDVNFFPFFSNFLINCGFSRGIEPLPRSISRLEHYKNNAYDIDVICTPEYIFVIIRGSKEHIEQANKGFLRIAEFKKSIGKYRSKGN